MRTSGILMPVSSLPSPYGIGSLGAEAYRFVDFLAAAGQRYWQILPIGPTGYGDSPYQSFSAFAANPYLIDLDLLAQEGLLDYAAMDIKNSPDRYAETCGGVDLLGPVKRSAALLMAGAVDYEFRTTVCAPLHTPEEMAGIGRWLKGAKRYFLQPFVDSGELVGSGMKPLTKEEIEALRDSVLPDIPSTQIRGQ